MGPALAPVLGVRRLAQGVPEAVLGDAQGVPGDAVQGVRRAGAIVPEAVVVGVVKTVARFAPEDVEMGVAETIINAELVSLVVRMSVQGVQVVMGGVLIVAPEDVEVVQVVVTLVAMVALVVPLVAKEDVKRHVVLPALPPVPAPAAPNATAPAWAARHN